MEEIEIKRYEAGMKESWNEFVESSKNGTFLFNRGYMDYHAERFEDHSYMIYRKGRLYCILPANRRGDTLYSHQGLTYGGLVMGGKCSVEGILDVFNGLKRLLREEGIKKVIYKPVPHIYHRLPAEEDLYALFRNDGKLTVRNVSSTVVPAEKIRLNKDRREAVRRAKRKGLEVKESRDFKSFWEILENNLKTKYGASPVHSLEEIELLSGRFPQNIKLWGAFSGGEMLGGVICYYMSAVVHCQYISATAEGKKSGAIDLIVDYLLGQQIPGERYLDLGISNEDGGRYLNESLIYQKEGFGGRAICYDTYEIEIW